MVCALILLAELDQDSLPECYFIHSAVSFVERSSLQITSDSITIQYFPSKDVCDSVHFYVQDKVLNWHEFSVLVVMQIYADGSTLHNRMFGCSSCFVNLPVVTVVELLILMLPM